MACRALSVVREPVHPRARGELMHHAAASVSLPAVHPRARGTHTGSAGARALGRFIPARAGNSLVDLLLFLPEPVHPHARGELGGLDPGRLRFAGSSPRARGTHNLPRAHLCVERFIPARAGNSKHQERNRIVRPVHPRARGTLASRRAGAARIRFIPARAGNSNRAPRCVPDHRVHPRARGELVMPARLRIHEKGSSPRARGTHPLRHYAFLHFRFIPARAGNSSWP